MILNPSIKSSIILNLFVFFLRDGGENNFYSSTCSPAIYTSLAWVDLWDYYFISCVPQCPRGVWTSCCWATAQKNLVTYARHWTVERVGCSESMSAHTHTHTNLASQDDTIISIICSTPVNSLRCYLRVKKNSIIKVQCVICAVSSRLHTCGTRPMTQAEWTWHDGKRHQLWFMFITQREITNPVAVTEVKKQQSYKRTLNTNTAFVHRPLLHLRLSTRLSALICVYFISLVKFTSHILRWETWLYISV